MTMEKVMEKTMEIQDKKQGKNKQTKQLALWIGALILGAILGALGIEVLSGTSELPQNLEQTSYYDHILGVIPNNIIKPFAEGNVLSILLLAAAAGIALAKMPQSNKKEVVVKGLLGLQDLLFMLIRGLIWALPLGIVAFAAQLSAQFSAGIVMDSLGKYVAIILGGNVIQFFIVLPLFLLARGINPVRTLSKMMPAVLMALFTKSSAATLPVTMNTAETRMGVSNKVSRFVLPICTTINMNGCAAFILVTSLFLMQNGGIQLSLSTMILWLFISVLSAVGNAGVPMGCYFLTLSLMSGMNAPIGIMGIILPIYTIIDMIETAENVWSDSCVCAMVDKDMQNQVLPYQCFFQSGDIGSGTKAIISQYRTLRKTSVYSIHQGMEEIHLIGRKVFRLLDKQRLASIQ